MLLSRASNLHLVEVSVTFVFFFFFNDDIYLKLKIHLLRKFLVSYLSNLIDAVVNS